MFALGTFQESAIEGERISCTSAQGTTNCSKQVGKNKQTMIDSDDDSNVTSARHLTQTIASQGTE